MHVEIGAEAALFPEKEYIKGIFVAVQDIAVNFYINVLQSQNKLNSSTNVHSYGLYIK
jgi:hypothetical protein